MAIEAGCYSMILVCDAKGEKQHIEGGDFGGFPITFRRTFTGPSEQFCIKDARKRGWLFKRNGETYCPMHRDA